MGLSLIPVKERLACSRCLDSGGQVKSYKASAKRNAMGKKTRGDCSIPIPSLFFPSSIFSPGPTNFSIAPHHLNAWNRLRERKNVWQSFWSKICELVSGKLLQVFIYIHSYTDAPYNFIKADSKSCGYVRWIHRVCVDGSRHPQIKCCVFQNIRIPACGRGPS